MRWLIKGFICLLNGLQRKRKSDPGHTLTKLILADIQNSN